MRFSSKIVLRVAAIGVAAAAIGLPATAAQASTNVVAAVTATPNTNLTNGESVTVAGTNFTASENVLVVECANPADQATCDETTDLVSGTTDNAGSFSVSFPVETGAVGSSACAPGGTCYIAAESFSSDPTMGDAQAATPITFSATVSATPNTNLTNGESVTVAGQGFGESENVILVECSDPADQSTCDETTDVVSGTTDNTGAFSVSFPVETGAVGAGNCAPGDTCYIGAASYASSPLAPDAQSAAPITFANGPALSVTPSTSLKNGQHVTVSAVNFPDGENYAFSECSAPDNAATCDAAHAVTGTVSGTGTFSSSFTVRTGTTGTGTCKVGGTCYIEAEAFTTSVTSPDTTAGATIKFAPAPVPPPVAHATPNSGLKNKQTVTLSGSRFPQHNSLLYVVECNANLLKAAPKGGENACDTTTLNTSGKTNAKGSFSGLKFKVETGKVGTGAAAGTCGVGHPCFIAVTTTLSGATADSAAAPISFGTAKTKTSAHASAKKVGSGKTFTISGAFKSGGKGIKDAKVVLYERAKGKKAWHKVKGYTTKAGGKFKTGKLKGPKHTEQYLVKHHKGSAGGFSYGASQSKIITVKK